MRIASVIRNLHWYFNSFRRFPLRFVISHTFLIIRSHAVVKAQATAVEQSTGEAVPKVESPVVVVTGASRGIGKAIALSLGKAGCKVGTLHHLLLLI